MIKVVGVQFQNGSGRTYEYKTYYNFDKGDLAVVLTDDQAYKIVNVVEVKEPDQQQFQGELKWIAGRVDLAAQQS